MLTVRKLRKKPQHFQRFTGLRVDAFDTLLKALEPLYNELDYARKTQRERRRAVGGGPGFSLALEDRLLMTLLYLRLYLTQPLVGYLFSLDDSSVSREISRRMLPALLEVLPLPMREELGLVQVKAPPAEDEAAKEAPVAHSHPGCRKRIGSLAELLEAHPEMRELFLDSTEQETPRPEDALLKKQRYSGKKKRHTLKTQLTTTKDLIVHVSRHVPGRVSDLVLVRFTGVLRQVPSRCTVRVDRGYESIEQEYPSVLIEKPIRKPRNHRLTALGKAINQMQNRFRVAVEHVLGRLKKYQMLSGRYRGRSERYDDCFAVCAGLHNYRTMNTLSW